MVEIISGKDRGKRGKVLTAFPKSEKIIVEGVALRKKHRRPRRQGQKGEIVSIASPIDISNMKIICPKCAKATRVGYKVAQDIKYRACKKCGEAV